MQNILLHLVAGHQQIRAATSRGSTLMSPRWLAAILVVLVLMPAFVVSAGMFGFGARVLGMHLAP